MTHNQQRAQPGEQPAGAGEDGATRQLREVHGQLSLARQHLRHAQKLATLGQLAAGVAHEINNPVAYLQSNICTLQDYLQRLFRVLDAYQDAEPSIAEAEVAANLRRLREQTDLSFIRADMALLLDESHEGITRVRTIAQDLQNFSRADSDLDWVCTDVHRNIETTLNIVSHELQYRAEVIREYGDLPDIECLPSQLNQVIMNLLVNAAQALGERRGTIIVRTGRDDDAGVWIEVEDSGLGIRAEHLKSIFEPFFTTKPVGKGTGLGLALARDIVLKHQGDISVSSVPGRGSTFRVRLPVRHAWPPRESTLDGTPPQA